MAEIFAVPVRGVGKPDYSKEISKGREIPGYVLTFDEQFMWLIRVFVAAPGASGLTRLPLAIGETARLINPLNGDDHMDIPVGWDFILKELWVTFNQDVYLELSLSGVFNDVFCNYYFNAGQQPINVIQISPRRSMMDDINIASVLTAEVTNLGAAPACGKAWMAGMMKPGVYTWV